LYQHHVYFALDFSNIPYLPIIVVLCWDDGRHGRVKWSHSRT